MNKTALVGGSAKFEEFIRLAGVDYERVTLERAIGDGAFTSMILLPDYDNGKSTVDIIDDLDLLELLAKRKYDGFKMYSENYFSVGNYNASLFGYDVVCNVCNTHKQTLCAVNGLQNYLGDGRILQASDTIYLPAVARLTYPYALENKVLLYLGNYIGTSQVNSLNDPQAYPALVKTGSFITAAISLSNYDNANMHPTARYKKLFGYIFSFVTGIDSGAIEAAFASCFPPIKTRFRAEDKLDAKELKEHFERALYSAAKWHIDSGIVLGEHGERGAVEMIMSGNRQMLYKCRRVDSGMYTGWLLYAAGKYFDNAEWLTTGKNVFDYFMANSQLSGGIVDGMFDWYHNKYAGPKWAPCFGGGYCGIALCNMYRLTGEAQYLAAIKRFADSVAQWITDGKLRGGYICYDGKDFKANNLVADGVTNPEKYSTLIPFMVMASSLLGDDKYLDKVAESADMLYRIYPNYEKFGHTTSTRTARLLCDFLPVHLSGKRDYTEIINTLIEYLASIRLPCGAIYAEDNLSFEANSKRDGEYGIVTPWDNDLISDQLYCVNNALVALSLLKKLPDDTKIDKAKGLDLLRGLLEYIVKIQIVSDDKRFNGGWMRAYSITQGEYYGLDSDILWSCYCIMAGWTMGILPLAILGELADDCHYFIS